MRLVAGKSGDKKKNTREERRGDRHRHDRTSELLTIARARERAADENTRTQGPELNSPPLQYQGMNTNTENALNAKYASMVQRLQTHREPNNMASASVRSCGTTRLITQCEILIATLDDLSVTGSEFRTDHTPEISAEITVDRLTNVCLSQERRKKLILTHVLQPEHQNKTAQRFLWLINSLEERLNIETCKQFWEIVPGLFDRRICS